MQVSNSGFIRYALTCCVAAAMLASCGGSQPPIGEPGVGPQTLAIATHADRGTSWMLPEAKSEDLLYVSDWLDGTVTVYSYKTQKLVGTLSGFSDPSGLCTDKRGDVFVTDLTSSQIVEYAHGGKESIKKLSEPGYLPEPDGCSVDETTGNLAVTNNLLDGRRGIVMIYKDATGRPTTYTDDPGVQFYRGCSYDDSGNLFITADQPMGLSLVLRELLRGSKNFTSIKLNKNIAYPSGGYYNGGGVQWDGTYVVIEDHHGDKLYRFMIEGQTGRLEGATNLSLARDIGQFWIEGSQVVGANAHGGMARDGTVMFWNYPAGGSPIRTITKGLGYPYGVTVSKAD